MRRGSVSMKRPLRCRPSPGLVIACVALFISLGPAAYAAHEVILSTDIVDGEVKTPDIANAAVVNGKIAGNAVNGAKVAADSLSGADVQESSLGKVPSAANADTLNGLGPELFARSTWYRQTRSGVGLVLGSFETCGGNQRCFEKVTCARGDIAIGGGYAAVDGGTRVESAYTTNAGVLGGHFQLTWVNNSTADTVEIAVDCLDQ
jgi:hypothetical protein